MEQNPEQTRKTCKLNSQSRTTTRFLKSPQQTPRIGLFTLGLPMPGKSIHANTGSYSIQNVPAMRTQAKENSHCMANNSYFCLTSVSIHDTLRIHQTIA